MRVSMLALSGVLLLASCSKTAPVPPTLVGTWYLVSDRVVIDFRDGTPPDDQTIAAVPGEPPLEFTVDGRVFFRLPGATMGSFQPYRFDGATIVVSLGAVGDVRWTVQELSAHRLVYQDVDEGPTARTTETLTYRR